MYRPSLAALSIVTSLLGTIGCGVAMKSPSARSPAASIPSQNEIDETLDDFHDAAARSDEARYFGHFAARGIFLGTDATERWSVEEFRAYAHPKFAIGKGWVMHARVRHVQLAVGGDVAWFDEELETKNLGPARGSGVLVREEGRWKLAQYNLAITVPNARFLGVKTLLEAPKS